MLALALLIFFVEKKLIFMFMYFEILGHGWRALLISGYDERKDGLFNEDVNAVKKMITSKCPLVMGVR